jgi:hypothetical protein
MIRQKDGLKDDTGILAFDVVLPLEHKASENGCVPAAASLVG